MDKETAINKASAIVNDYINTHKAEESENFTEFTAWLTDHYGWAESVYGFEFLYETMVATALTDYDITMDMTLWFDSEDEW